MLKIKDEVELKELKKFGFYYDCGNWHKDSNRYIEYWINSWRNIEIFVNDESEVVLDNTVYELIQAGLVEKLEE